MTHMGFPYLISSSGVMQCREVCYTVVSYAPYILLQIYTITNLDTYRVTNFDFFHPGPQPMLKGLSIPVNGHSTYKSIDVQTYFPYAKHSRVTSCPTIGGLGKTAMKSV